MNFNSLYKNIDMLYTGNRERPRKPYRALEEVPIKSCLEETPDGEIQVRSSTSWGKHCKV